MLAGKNKRILVGFVAGFKAALSRTISLGTSGQWLAVGHTATDKLQLDTTCSSSGRRLEEPVSPVRQSLSGVVVVPRTIHPFPRCPKPARESRLSKLAFYCQCVFRRRRRTRPTISLRTACHDVTSRVCDFDTAVRHLSDILFALIQPLISSWKISHKNLLLDPVCNAYLFV